jgi:hypothetical protein
MAASVTLAPEPGRERLEEASRGAHTQGVHADMKLGEATNSSRT